MLLSVPKGATSKIIEFPVFDSSSNVGATLSGLANNTANLTAYYNLDATSGNAVAISLVSATKGTYTANGFIAVDATNMPGWYQLGVPNGALSNATANYASIMLKGAANMVPVNILLEMTAWNNQDSVRGGMTALPNANASVAGGLITFGTGTGQANVAGGRIDGDLHYINGSNMTAPATAGILDVNIKNYSNQTVSVPAVTGVPKVDMVDILGTAVFTPATAGILDINLKNIANVAVSNTTPQLGTNVIQVGGSNQTARDLGTSVLISSGTGTGQLSVASGVIAANMAQILGTTVATPATAGLMDTNVKNIANAVVSTAAAQIGVNLVNIAGSGVSNSTAQLGVNAVQIGGAVPGSATIGTVANVTAISAGGINNAAFNADVNTTAYATNNLALMMYKFFDNAFTGYADGTTFTANGLLDRLTKLMWIMRNQINVTDSTGTTQIYKDDNSTVAFQSPGGIVNMLTDNSTTTQRLRAA